MPSTLRPLISAKRLWTAPRPVIVGPIPTLFRSEEPAPPLDYDAIVKGFSELAVEIHRDLCF